MRSLTWLLVIVLFIAHQDFWYWGDRRLVFGFLPIGLAYHMIFSIAAAGVWALAVRYAWPQTIEDWAERESDG